MSDNYDKLRRRGQYERKAKIHKENKEWARKAKIHEENKQSFIDETKKYDEFLSFAKNIPLTQGHACQSDYCIESFVGRCDQKTGEFYFTRYFAPIQEWIYYQYAVSTEHQNFKVSTSYRRQKIREDNFKEFIKDDALEWDYRCPMDSKYCIEKWIGLNTRHTFLGNLLFPFSHNSPTKWEEWA